MDPGAVTAEMQAEMQAEMTGTGRGYPLTLDMAGVSNDIGRAYAAKGGSGWGVRLLLELARAQVAAEA